MFAVTHCETKSFIAAMASPSRVTLARVAMPGGVGSLPPVRSTNQVLAMEAQSPEPGLGAASPPALATPPPLMHRAGRGQQGGWPRGARRFSYLAPRGSGLTTSGPREEATPEPRQARAGRPAVARRDSKEAAPTGLRAAWVRPEARDRKRRAAGTCGPPTLSDSRD